MSPTRKTPVTPRKMPRQARSRDTVDTICTAATRILEQDGPSALTTNRVARRAGVSIGSLYEYFPNKEAILVELARRLTEHDRRRVRDSLQRSHDATPEERVRALIRAVIDLHAENVRLRRLLLEAYLAHGFRGEDSLLTVELMEWIRTHRTTRPLVEHLSATAWFVLSRAVLGAVRAALWEGSPILWEPGLEDELVTLAVGFLNRSSR